MIARFSEVLEKNKNNEIRFCGLFGIITANFNGLANSLLYGLTTIWTEESSVSSDDGTLNISGINFGDENFLEQ